MKKIMLAAAVLLAAISPAFAQNNTLQITATGTGQTTGDVALLTLHNPSNQAVTTTIGPCFIPSSSEYQSYIVPTAVPITVQPGATNNLPLRGYCADIFTAPVPNGVAMSAAKDWISVTSLSENWKPLASNGWEKAPGSSALIPGTGRPLGHTIDVQKHPKEAAPILFEALKSISNAYDKMKNEGSVVTPFSGNPEKEREAVIQQTFWIYAAELSGKGYKVEDFSQNTVRQFEAATGQNFEKQPAEVQNQVQGGVVDFWNTFQAVGAEAKTLAKKPDYFLCYTKVGCAAGSYVGSVRTEADCKAVGGKSVRKGLLGDCKNL
jgi:hypothetical protein